MTTNETSRTQNVDNSIIAKWLGFSRNLATIEDYYWRVDENGNDDLITPDFLHDRNQQKWIEDELEKRGYRIEYTYDPDRKKWAVFLWKEENLGTTKYKCIEGKKVDSLKDTAFIEAVLELIEKEEIK